MPLTVFYVVTCIKNYQNRGNTYFLLRCPVDYISSNVLALQVSYFVLITTQIPSATCIDYYQVACFILVYINSLEQLT